MQILDEALELVGIRGYIQGECVRESRRAVKLRV
jgi:hypothetical protein